MHASPPLVHPHSPFTYVGYIKHGTGLSSRPLQFASPVLMLLVPMLLLALVEHCHTCSRAGPLTHTSGLGNTCPHTLIEHSSNWIPATSLQTLVQIISLTTCSSPSCSSTDRRYIPPQKTYVLTNPNAQLPKPSTATFRLGCTTLVVGAAHIGTSITSLPRTHQS